MNSKKFSFKIDKFEDTNEVLENTNFRKVKIMIMHTGENYNGSIFTEDSIDESINTLPNIPILAYVEKEDSGNKDFKAHESSYDIFTDKDGKIKIREYFNEIPIGVVPESNEYFKEEIDGEIYLGCYAYIWKCYSNDAYDILEEDRQKEISMEVLFTDFYDDKNNKCNVNKFEFLAITCLGAKYGGAMGKECNLSMDFSIDNSNSKKMEYATAVEKLNKILKFNEVKEVVNDMSDDKKT
ncbi:hypothetical protein, partial [Clostridium sp.]|uniref:hypothetical protein n=1 Tax=Clostridium sp. TaxID=1506 RepID=UPI003AA6D0C6